MLGYSVMVLIVVRYGKKNLKTVYIILSLCLVWGGSGFLCIGFLVPQVYVVSFIVGAVCLPIPDGSTGEIILTVIILVIFTFVPLVGCSVVSLIVLHYIRKHSITGDTKNNKAVAKLSLFLLTGILINAVSWTVSSILTYFSAGGIEVIYSTYAVGVLSLYPTPILIIAFLKPIRDKMKTFLPCKSSIHRKVAKISDTTEESAPNMN